jgi:nucleoside-diphosphate-sugar epimerase
MAVTGGAGFIGSNLVRTLLDAGDDVVIIDDFSRGNEHNLRDLAINCEIRRVDLRNFELALKSIEEAEVVFHLAARVGSINYLHGSKRNELDALQSNLIIDANVFRACVQNGVKKLIYASSVAVYPVEDQEKSGSTFSEDSLNHYNPEGGYGWSKLMGEIELAWTEGLDIGIARIFNIYGENSAMGKSSHVVTSLIRKAVLYPREKYVVWGDGQQTRDFLYVGDCVEALIKIQGKATKELCIINIGSDNAVKISTLAEKIARISGKNMEIIYDPRQPSGPFSRTSDNTQAKMLLNWEPKVSIDEGLRRTYKWEEKRLKGQINPSISPLTKGR